MNAAVPPLVSCAEPIKFTPVHAVAAALQKFTCPTATGVLPASTVAVRVTTLPDVTVVTALPPELTASAVVVAAGPGAAETVTFTEFHVRPATVRSARLRNRESANFEITLDELVRLAEWAANMAGLSLVVEWEFAILAAGYTCFGLEQAND